MMKTAEVTKVMRTTIKARGAVMSCTLKNWKQTRTEAASDVIYISGGMGINGKTWKETAEDMNALFSELEAIGAANSFTVITKDVNFGRLWMKRVYDRKEV